MDALGELLGGRERGLEGLDGLGLVLVRVLERGLGAGDQRVEGRDAVGIAQRLSTGTHDLELDNMVVALSSFAVLANLAVHVEADVAGLDGLAALGLEQLLAVRGLLVQIAGCRLDAEVEHVLVVRIGIRVVQDLLIFELRVVRDDQGRIGELALIGPVAPQLHAVDARALTQIDLEVRALASAVLTDDGMGVGVVGLAVGDLIDVASRIHDVRSLVGARQPAGRGRLAPR